MCKFSMFANDTFDELAAVAGGRRPKAIAGEFSECIILGTPFHTTPSYSHQFPISTPLFPIAALVNGSISPCTQRWHIVDMHRDGTFQITDFEIADFRGLCQSTEPLPQYM